MMGDDDRDSGDIAEQLADALSEVGSLSEWTFQGLDIGEINVTTPTGQKFRLYVEELQDD